MILAGDIGGTNTRLVLQANDGRIERGPQVFRNVELKDLADALDRFLAGLPQGAVTAAGLAVAGPVADGVVRVTNFGWTLDETTLRERLGTPHVRLLNDLEAAAHGVLALAPTDWRTLSLGDPLPGATIGLIAAGTGLGEALIAFHDGRPVVIASEGGHADFAPRDPTDVALLEWLLQSHAHVSWERVVSGAGIRTIYTFLRDTGRADEPAALRARLAAADHPAAVITAAAVAGAPAICVETVELFVRAYGAEAGNLALKGLTRGAMFVAGGIAPHLLDGRLRDRFMEAFVAKGRYEALLRAIPVRVVSGEAGLAGAAAVARRLRDLGQAG